MEKPTALAAEIKSRNQLSSHHTPRAWHVLTRVRLGGVFAVAFPSPWSVHMRCTLCVRLATCGVRGEGHLDIATAFGAGFRGTFREVIEGGGHRVRRVFSGFTEGYLRWQH